MKIITTLVLTISSLLSLKWGGDEDKRKEKVFEIYSHDSVRIEVALIYDEQDLPEQYYSHVVTPVCKEGLCHLVEIDLYWDLLGNFLAYQVPADKPLTKFDHEAFTQEDHQKLLKILTDKRSILAEHQVEDLIDENTELVSDEVDAVTGATKKTVENAVVSGAVYSTYTLWHIANGEIAEKIPHFTESLWNEALLQHFLHADHYPYIYYALDHIPQEQYVRYMPSILHLIEKGSVFVSRYALANIPAAILKDQDWQLALVTLYPQLDYKSRDMMIQRLQQVPVYGKSMDLLSQHLDELSESQLYDMLDLFTQNKTALHENAITQMVELVYHGNPLYATKGYQTLKALGLKNKKVKKAIISFENSK